MACYLVLPGDDNNAFLSQAKQYRLGDKVQLLTEIVDQMTHPRRWRCGGRADRRLALSFTY